MNAADAAVDNPWPGLAAFEEAWAANFYGRNGPADELLRLIRREISTVLFGQSGLGKTSLLQAGLAPRLRTEGFTPIIVRMSYDPSAPSLRAQLRYGLLQAHKGQPETLKLIVDEADVWCALHRNEYPAIEDESQPIPVIILDQFEEFFSRRPITSTDLAEDESFLADLANLIENRPPAGLRERITADPSIISQYALSSDRYRIVFSLREDFLSHLELIRKQAPTLGRNRLRLERMTGDQAFEAVIGPGRGLVNPPISEAIVRFVGRAANQADLPDEQVDRARAGQDGVLPLHSLSVDPSLLSLFCQELNERRKAEGRDQIDRDLFFASKDDILTDFYARALADQPDIVRRVIEDELISPDGTIRVDKPVVQFVQAIGSREALDTLVGRRILRIEERQFQRVELIHDVLVSVVAESRRDRLERQRLDQVRTAELEEREVRQRAAKRMLIGVASAIAVIGLIVAAVIALKLQRSKERAEQQVFACVISFAPAGQDQKVPLARYRLPAGSLKLLGGANACGATLTQVLRKAGRSPGDIVAWWAAISAINGDKDPVQRAQDLGRAIDESGASGDANYRAQVAAAYSYQAMLFTQAGKRADAETAQRHAMTTFLHSPEAKQHPEDLAGLYHDLGDAELANDKPQDARTQFAQALALRQHIAPSSRLLSGATSNADREGLAEAYAALGRVSAALAQRNPADRALIEVSDKQYDLCRSLDHGAGMGLSRNASELKLIRAKCFADQGRALQQIDPVRARRSLIFALSEKQFDLSNLAPDERENYYEMLTWIASYDEKQMLANGEGASDRARKFRTWLVVAKRDVFAAEPTRENRDQLIQSLVDRTWYFIYANNVKAAVIDADAATYLDANNIPLKFVRGHAALLDGNIEKAETLYGEAGRLMKSSDKEIAQLRTDFAVLNAAGRGDPALFAKALDMAKNGGGAGTTPAEP